MDGVGDALRTAPSSTKVSDGRRLLAARAAWIVANVLIVGLYLVTLPTAYAEFGQVCAAGVECKPYWRLAPADVVALRDLGLSVDLYAAYRIVAEIVYMLGSWIVAAIIFWRRSDSLLALFFSFMLVAFGALNIISLSQEVSSALGSFASLVAFCAWTSFFAAFYVFPDGRFVPGWTRLALPVAVLYNAALFFAPRGSFMDPANWPPPLVITLTLCLLGTVVFAQIYRYRRISGLVERQQTKWVVFGFVAALVLGTSLELMPLASPSLETSGLSGVVFLFSQMTVSNLSLLLIPLALGIAILRYRLWDVDAIINRTLVYVALTAILVGVYVLIVGALGALLHARANLLVSLPAAGLVAVLFAPLRERLQRGVNRLMYGERDDPYRILSRLNRRLGATFEPGSALSTIVETVAGALKLPYAAVAIRRGDDFEVAASQGTPTGDETVLPLSYGGETVGRLLLAPRSPGEAFSPADRRLLEDLARNAEAAVYAVGLTADLQRSRERLVSAREEERRRLRRDLHDGLGPTLASLMLGLDVSLRLLNKSPDKAEEMLSRLKAQTKEAVVDIRRLVYGLRPPALDDLGLVAAIREQAAAHGRLREETEAGTGLGFVFEAPEDLPPLPAAVEVACYRIAQEAITNVARHARATMCRVNLSIEGPVEGGKRALILDVSDDGVGLPDPSSRRAGVGLSSMRERTEELGGDLSVAAADGGGTRVSVRLPLPETPEEATADGETPAREHAANRAPGA